MPRFVLAALAVILFCVLSRTRFCRGNRPRSRHRHPRRKTGGRRHRRPGGRRLALHRHVGCPRKLRLLTSALRNVPHHRQAAQRSRTANSGNGLERQRRHRQRSANDPFARDRADDRRRAPPASKPIAPSVNQINRAADSRRRRCRTASTSSSRRSPASCRSLITSRSSTASTASPTISTARRCRWRRRRTSPKSSIPKNIDSLELLTGAIPAEYGGDRMGGVVNIITSRPDRSTRRVFTGRSKPAASETKIS